MSGDSFIFLCGYAGVGRSRFTVVHMEEDMQVMIMTVALLIQKAVTVNLLLPTPPYGEESEPTVM